ncbi:STAS domain-containing protein [Alteribacter natronophilus]|uniref:STAS domain-containing protein n=1 Tax=Alteribacter natronophilus TaxID=2583810 RepID=UPI00110F3EA2|nr:STAS domain-containing protein [Alteribacter natronophilus]TMW71246.1 STAS domain-containing protein [Alteribacter natronophilus]
MKPGYQETYADYFSQRQEEFQETLLSDAAQVRDKVNEVLLVGNIDLLDNAHKLVMYALTGEDGEPLSSFAEKEGVAWAQHELTLSFKLEWVQTIRRTMWRFLETFQEAEGNSSISFFELERQVNDIIDQFLNGFFLSYSRYKDALLEAQQKMVENLSAPIIPLSKAVCVLPLIGELDEKRVAAIEKKILPEINRLQMETLIIDFSGIANIDSPSMNRVMTTINGTYMMGCECVITGMRPEIVLTLTKEGLTFDSKIITKGSLEQTVNDYLIVNDTDMPAESS